MGNKVHATNVEFSNGIYIGNYRQISLKEKEKIGFFEGKIDLNCKIPKYLQSAFINSTIKYDSTEQNIVNNYELVHYHYQKDIAVLLEFIKLISF